MGVLNINLLKFELKSQKGNDNHPIQKKIIKKLK